MALRHLPLFAVLLAGAADAGDPWQQTLEAWREALGITGIQATVILPDGRAVTRTAGLARAGSAVQANTVFETGSITKTYTAALALRLVEDGRLSLDDRLGERLPGTELDPGITLRQLLNHTSGLFNASSHPEYLAAQLAEPEKAWKPEDNLAFLEAPYFPPGTAWRYSNTNYIVAGMVIEAATGESVKALLEDLIFEPAELRRTTFGDGDELPEPRAHAFIDVQGDDAPEDISAAMPATAFLTSAWTAGAVLSTSAELASWIRRLHSCALLSSEAYREMTTFIERPDGMQYGLGVLRMSRDGETWLGHKGNSAGFSGAAWHLKESGVTVAVLTNAHLLDVQPISDALVTLAQGRAPVLPDAADEPASETADIDRLRAADLAAAVSSVLGDDRAEEAIEMLEKAIELDPKDPGLHKLLGDACVEAISPGRPMEAFKLGNRAQAAYAEALAIDPSHVGARMGLLRYYLGAPAILGGSTAKALEQAAILEATDEIEAWKAYRMIYTHIGDDEQAAEYDALLSTSGAENSTR